MSEIGAPTSREELERDWRRRFIAGAGWPLQPGELAALIDLGMSSATIAAYFGVAEDRVAALVNYYGLPAGGTPVRDERRKEP